MGIRRSKFNLMVVIVITLSCFLCYQLFTRQRVKNTKKQLSAQFVSNEAVGSVKAVDKPMDKPLTVAPVINNFAGDRMDFKERAFSLNFLQDIHNTDQFGEHNYGDLIILVQIHDRPENLRHLLTSLKNTRGIANATLVISRDYFSDEIDSIIESINFVRYIEIFFPFSMQLYHGAFPGEDPNDCPRDISKQDARDAKCNNAEHPDMYGHYREVKFVQIKHHWFWKLNMVFSGMRVFQHSASPVLLLEEDYYVVPDIIHCVRKVLEMKISDEYPVISLGNYDKSPDYYYKGTELQVVPWVSSKHNMGMVLKPSFYEQFLLCTEQFCDFDDYNWDWSLQAVSPNCMQKSLHVISFSATRVYHIGTCGTHTHGTCDIDAVVQKTLSNFQNSNLLFPSNLQVSKTDTNRAPTVTPNGGWGDVRDRTLCKKYHAICSSLLKN